MYAGKRKRHVSIQNCSIMTQGDGGGGGGPSHIRVMGGGGPSHIRVMGGGGTFTHQGDGGGDLHTLG